MSPARQRLFIATLTAAVALTACSSDTGDRVAGPGELGHIHDLVIDEDQLGNTERKHTTEQVAFFIIDPPLPEESTEAPVLALRATRASSTGVSFAA